MKVNYQNVNTNKLHDELIAGGVVPVLVESSGINTWITYKDGENMMLVDSIVAVHNPAPIPPSLQSLNLTSNKAQIIADGLDTATVTITLSPTSTGISIIDVLVDGPPIIECNVTNDTATFLFSATSAGKYMIEAISGNVRNYIFVKAV